MVQKSNDATGDNQAPNDNGLASDQQEDIWTSILKGVASSKIVPTKSLLILGDRESGKSTLIRQLKGEKDEEVYEVNGVSKDAEENDNFNKKHHSDLALSYTFTEVKDDEADTLARLGLYQLAGSQEAYQSLLHFALNSTTLPDSLVVIVLDWARPWTFVETLQRWIKFIELGIERVKKEGSVGAKDDWTKGKAIVEEMQETLERFIRNYTKSYAHEPDTSTANGTVPASSEEDEVTLPLGDGVLTTNLAVPLVVVCTKSDNVTTLEKQMDYREEQFEYIQQSLRTICLKYGAALFYTTTRDPKTFENLRQYILHRLIGSKSSSGDSKSSYPFNVEPKYTEHTVLVPTGWDSWNQIKYLRDGFDCDGLLQGWDLDMTGEKETTEDSEEVISAKKLYEDAIKNIDNEKPLSDPSIIEAEDEQEFFKRHYDTLQKANSERPPSPSVVGPMSAPQYPYANIGADILEPETLTSTRPTIKKQAIATTSPPPGMQNGSQPVIPPGPQNEVLANFFQALLTKKNQSTNPGSSQPQLPSNEPPNNILPTKPISANAPSRKMVESELERMKKLSSHTA
ncbi:dynein light intermediate chain-domain-containing protein [Gigaspora rosea]|uniref:Dynein light intermediate chain-domain-containing protein n=1 Tax=Gigaspora rosea TaxID=44941 RepID=A0A397UGI7_9GLOM|nr:dynein light intermediate chain-domain-containing protein [Gigaspora rosea]